jgi:cold shock CspA family protein
MGRSQETLGKKEVRNKKEKKRKEKLEKREKKKTEGKSSINDMIAYVDEFGKIRSTPQDPDKTIVFDAENKGFIAPKKTPEKNKETERKGVVIFLNDAKGFGFIRDNESGQKYFFHVSGLLEPVKLNNNVIFEKSKSARGISAIKISIAR